VAEHRTLRPVKTHGFVLSVLGIAVLILPACASGTDTAARDRCEAQYGVGNCVARHGTFVPLGVPLTTTPTTESGADSCQALGDASKAASAVFYANSSPSSFPSDYFDLTSPQKVLDIPSGVTPNPPAAGDKVLTGKGWTLTMSAGGATAPIFTCDH